MRRSRRCAARSARSATCASTSWRRITMPTSSPRPKQRIAALEEELAALQRARRDDRPTARDAACRRHPHGRRTHRGPGAQPHRRRQGPSVISRAERSSPQCGPGEALHALRRRLLRPSIPRTAPHLCPARQDRLRPNFAPSPPARRPYIDGRGCGARQEFIFPGALSILKGAVPDPVPGPGHTAPTYVVGSRDRSSDGFLRLRTLPS